tara:strand:+ start:672 stop:884 length:213 start_codon:yes stop_codon:yes gene_type:complete
MKTTIKKFNSLIEHLQNKFDNMEETFWDRSDNWQESDKGQEFEDKMNCIDNAINELQLIIDELETEFNLN